MQPRPSSESVFSDNTVNLRIETNLTTIYEGPITSGPRNITAGEGEYKGTTPCNGQNGLPPGANPGKPPGNTPTDALDAAAKARGFTYDGNYDNDTNDFDITRIATTRNWGAGDIYQYWGMVVNYQVSTFGWGLWLSGCQQLVNPGDEVLWAFMQVGASWNDDTNPEISFLKLTPTAVTVKKGKGFTVTVIDGRTGNLTQNAIVAGVKTDAQGKATLYPSHVGTFKYKATRKLDIRSNAITVTVTA